jgi:glycosyltransferase involved in cell wall biosynthesis
MSQSCDADRGVAVSLTPLALEADSRAYRIACSLADDALPAPGAAQRTVVLVTPVRLEADSRTFKEACSLGRAGYATSVVEGEASAQPPTGPFALMSPGPDEAGAAATAPAVGAIRRQRLDRLRRGPFGVLVDYAIFVPFVAGYAARQLRLRRLPIPVADLYVLHSAYYYPAVRWLARRRHAGIVYDAHDFYPVLGSEHRRTARQEWQKNLFNRIEGACLRRAVAAITVSDGIAGLMEGYFGRRPAVVRNLHDERLDREATTSIRQMAGVDADDFLFVCIGNYKPGMAIGPALAALARVPHRVHLAFVGRGYSAIADMVATSEVGARLHLLGPAPPDQLVPFVAAADAAIMLYYPQHVNYLHALPNGLFQSLAAGLPLIHPDLPEIRAVVAGLYSALMADPLSVDALVAAIEALVGDQLGCARRRKAARLAANRFRWADEEGVFLDLIAAAMRPG